MKKLFLRSLGIAIFISNGLAYGAEPIRKNLTTNLVGENTFETVSLQATAKALDAAITAGKVFEAQTQLNCLNAMVGNNADVVVKTDVQVKKGWISNTTNKTEYIITGRNSLNNNIDVEMILSGLGFAKYQDIVKTDLAAKAAYLKSYLTVMSESLNREDVSMPVIQAFHNEFKNNFGLLTASEGAKTVEQLTIDAQVLATATVTEVVVPEVVKGWFGTKSKVGLGLAVVLIALSAGKRTI